MHTFIDPNPKKRRKKRKPLGKTQAPHRITIQQEKELLKMMGYTPLNPKKTQSRPALTNDLEAQQQEKPNDKPVIKDIANKPKVVRDLPGIG